MRKLLALCLIFLGLFSCRQETIRDVSVEIIFDHEINSNLSQNDSLCTFLKPTNFNDTFLNIIPLFTKIDSEQLINDSLHSNDGVISELQNWITQGKNSPTFFIKKRTKQIENANIDPRFSVKGDKRFVDTFYAKNKIELVIYSKRKYPSLYADLNGSGIKIFKSIDSLKMFIFSIKDSLSSKKIKLNILFDPEISIIPIVPLTIKTTPINEPIVNKIDDPKENNFIAIVKISSEECDRRIALCLSKPQGEEKVIFFFQEIFRFVKTNECINSSYKKLIAEIYNNLSALTPTKFDKNIDNRYYDLVCSNKTDFGSELEKYGYNINNSNYSTIFANCPPQF